MAQSIPVHVEDWVQFPAPTRQPTTVCNPVPGELMHMVHIKYMPTKHSYVQNKKIDPCLKCQKKYRLRYEIKFSLGMVAPALVPAFRRQEAGGTL